jgi:hypothetical protein
MQMRNFKDIMSTTEANKLTDVKTYQENEVLIYQRILGHRLEDPGSGQWIETSLARCPPTKLTDWM